MRQLLRAHQYWRMKQLAVDLVILNERPASYAQDLHAVGRGAGADESVASALRRRGRAGQRVRPARRPDFARGARLCCRARRERCLLSRRGSLSEQVKHLEEEPPAEWLSLAAAAAAGVSAAPFQAGRSGRSPSASPETAPPRPPMEFFNGLGGFAADGREYVTILGEGQWTPAPWVNVIANPSFGFQVSVEGGGLHVVGQQSRASADPVVERSGQRPPGRGDLRSRRRQRSALVPDGAADSRRGRAVRRPARTGLQPFRAHRARHRPRTAAVRAARRSDQDLAVEDPQSFDRNRAVSRSPPTWSGCSAPPATPSAQFVVTEIDADTGSDAGAQPLEQRVRWPRGLCRPRREATRLDRRPDGVPRPQRHARSAGRAGRRRRALQPSRRRSRSLWRPASAARRSSRTAWSRSSSFSVRQRRRAEALALVARYRAADLDAVLRSGDPALGRRPRRGAGEDTRSLHGHPAQSLAALPDPRLSGLGALGVLPGQRCLRLPRPAAGRDGARGVEAGADARASPARRGAAVRRGRRAALVAAAVGTGGAHAHLRRPGLAGVRRRPLRPGHAATLAVLDEMRPLPRRAGLSDRASTTRTSSRWWPRSAPRCSSTALAPSTAVLSVGAHGLPLIGAGDWNDGMNRVGEGGEGESVWLGWFLHATLSAFAPVAEARGEVGARRRPGDSTRTALRESLEREAWDGEWYRRGYFDDGTPLGSAASDECRIDSIAQSWAVISGGGGSGAGSARHGGGGRTPRAPRRRTGPPVHPALRSDAHSTPDTSRDTRPASARTAASTRMRPPGR